TAAACGQQEEALRHARRTLDHAHVLGLGFDSLRWAWPLAARTACDLHDTPAISDLLALLDSHPPGHVPPMLRAARDLTRARLAASDHDQATAASFAAAIASLRELSSPYHLAQGLLDYAEHNTHLGNADAAQTAVSEARDIARRLRCPPLLDRAADLLPAEPRIRVPMVTTHGPEESANVRDG